MFPLELPLLALEPPLKGNGLADFFYFTTFKGHEMTVLKSFHFHLCSHAGIGTVNPTFYQVLHDDNQLELDNLVYMTYALTMDAKRCERS